MDEAKVCSACGVCVYIYMYVLVLHCSRKYVPGLVRSNPNWCSGVTQLKLKTLKEKNFALKKSEGFSF